MGSCRVGFLSFCSPFLSIFIMTTLMLAVSLLMCVCVCVCVQVLTRDQVRQISAPKEEKHARAVYDFDGQAKKELSFNRVCVKC